mgnify:CR=1 FL=1
MFPKSFFPQQFFPENYFPSGVLVSGGHAGRETVESGKEPSTQTIEKPILAVDIEKASIVEYDDSKIYDPSLTEGLIEKALDEETKRVTTLQDKIRDEEEILLILGIIEAHEDF